jgi:hypothetical protein
LRRRRNDDRRINRLTLPVVGHYSTLSRELFAIESVAHGITTVTRLVIEA